MLKRSVYDDNKDGTGERRVGITDRRVGIAPAAVGTNAEWDDIREKRVGTNERRVGINGDVDGDGVGITDGGEVGITDRRVGIDDRRDGINNGAVGINSEKVGITGDWDDLREKRDGIDDRRIGINSGQVGKNITPNQQKILDNIAENQHVTMSELSAAVGISTRKIEANVQKLKAMGLIERVGARKNGYWMVKS
jgi:biotin operon repressor